MLTLLFIVIVLFTSVADTARILAVFPTPSLSHQVVFRPLTQELARRGHEVTVITTDRAFPKRAAPTNLTEIEIHDLSYKIWNDNVVKLVDKGNKDDIDAQVLAYLKSILEIVVQQLEVDEVKQLVNDKTKKYDLLFLEACVRPALVYSHIFKAPVIQISSFGAMMGNLEAIGAPEHPILYPNPLRQRINNLTMWDKVKEITNFYLFRSYFGAFEKVENEVFQKHFGPDIPSISELYENVHMLYLNVHPVFEGIRPVPQTVVFMGGIHQNPVTELPANLKSYLDAAKNGVIYVSFGTNVNTDTLPVEIIMKMIEVFSQLPYQVLWKWNEDELPRHAENIRISKWLPQSDLLRHPNIKLFITQGGLQSTDEAITAGVPMIGFPMLADQWNNVERYEYHKIGIKIDFGTLDEESFKNAIQAIIGDESYRNNVLKLRTLMYDQPMSPLERAVWWTEHVLRHGGARHLRAPAANISWAQYLELELVLTLLTSLLLLIFILICIIYYVCVNYVISHKVKDD